MPYREVFRHRAVNDLDRIAGEAIKSAAKVGNRIKAKIISEIVKTNSNFNVKAFIVDTMKPYMVLTSMASHLAGFRRFRLTLLQDPSLKKRWLAGTLKHPAVSASANSDVLNKTIKVLADRTGMDLEALQQKYDTDALKVLNGIGESAEQELEKTMRELVASGAHIRQAKEVLEEKFTLLGLVPKNNYSLENIFRTQTQLAFGAGKYQAEQDPDIQEILWGYKYSTVGDDRVRDEHLMLEGTTLPKNDPFWLTFYPPNGWSCRCQAIPIFEPMKIVKPPIFGSNGEDLIKPDKGFEFNPGLVFAVSN